MTPQQWIELLSVVVPAATQVIHVWRDPKTGESTALILENAAVTAEGTKSTIDKWYASKAAAPKTDVVPQPPKKVD